MEKNWIKGAIKHPGALTATAKGEGKSLSELCSESDLSPQTKKRCALRETLRKMHK
jgi:lambda repressor-like predicted transcriptional regulator